MDDPSIKSQPVEVTNPEPLPVSVVEPDDTTAQVRARSIAASAMVDADILRTEDSRRISGMWERTQQVIALSVVEVTLLVIALIVSAPGLATVFGFAVPESASAAASTGIVFLASVANLVIGFYFGRTNHSRVGGVADPGASRDGR